MLCSLRSVTRVAINAMYIHTYVRCVCMYVLTTIVLSLEFNVHVFRCLMYRTDVCPLFECLCYISINHKRPPSFAIPRGLISGTLSHYSHNVVIDIGGSVFLLTAALWLSCLMWQTLMPTRICALSLNEAVVFARKAAVRVRFPFLHYRSQAS